MRLWLRLRAQSIVESQLRACVGTLHNWDGIVKMSPLTVVFNSRLPPLGSTRPLSPRSDQLCIGELRPP